jgi:hypothetical protein
VGQAQRVVLLVVDSVSGLIYPPVVGQQARDELGGLIHQIMDAQSYEQAEAALATLVGHPLDATITRISPWSGRPWSGPSTTTSSPLNGGQSANVIIGIPARMPSKSPERHPDKSADWTLWACKRSRDRRLSPTNKPSRFANRRQNRVSCF